MAIARDNLLLGAWKFTLFVRPDIATGANLPTLDAHPEGYLATHPTGACTRYLGGGCVALNGDPPTDGERVQLHKSMLAYPGTYPIATDEVVHHTSILLGKTRLGSDQVRFFKLEGDKLTLTTERNKSAIDGGEGFGVLNF